MGAVVPENSPVERTRSGISDDRTHRHHQQRNDHWVHSPRGQQHSSDIRSGGIAARFLLAYKSRARHDVADGPVVNRAIARSNAARR
jgi:hypothetical protein